MHDPAHVEAHDRLMPAMRVRQVVREEGHAPPPGGRMPDPSPRDPSTIGRKAPQHGGAPIRPPTPVTRTAPSLHSAASAKRICGVTTVAIRRTSSRSPERL